MNLNVGERTCAARLAILIADELGLPDGLRVDVEYDRMVIDGRSGPKRLPELRRTQQKEGDVRPDLILHRRSGSKSNLLVGELKLAGRGRRKQRQRDISKLEAFTMPKANDGLGYKLGVFIDLGQPTSVRWFVRGKEVGAEVVPAT